MWALQKCSSLIGSGEPLDVSDRHRSAPDLALGNFFPDGARPYQFLRHPTYVDRRVAMVDFFADSNFSASVAGIVCLLAGRMAIKSQTCCNNFSDVLDSVGSVHSKH